MNALEGGRHSPCVCVNDLSAQEDAMLTHRLTHTDTGPDISPHYQAAMGHHVGTQAHDTAATLSP